MYLSMILNDLRYSKCNPVIVKIPEFIEDKDIQKVIELFNWTFWKVLINKTNLRKLKFFIPKEMKRTSFTDEIFSIYLEAFYNAKEIIENKKRKKICNVLCLQF